MKIRQLAVVLVCLLGILAPVRLMAHGGVSVDQDICLMKLGPYRSHFTGYQPEKRLTQEFCEDIPEVGNVVMVMDFISDELRDMQTDFRIVRDVKGVGNSAVYKDLGSAEDIARATVFYKPAESYPHGTLSAAHSFSEPGRFIGIVTATAANGEQYISVFPFAVGKKTYWRYLVMVVLAIAAAAALYHYSSREQKP